MAREPRCRLTLKDYTALETLLMRCDARSDPIAPAIHDKLSTAEILFDDDISPSLVTMNSRVAFRVDGGPLDSRILVADEASHLAGITLPVSTQRGLAMLGQMAGESVHVRRQDGRAETLRIEDIAYQPEAAARKASAIDAPARGGEPAATPPRVINLAARRAERAAAHAMFSRPDDDDPGPSAA